MEIKQFINPLIKWWWLVLVSTLVAVLASVYAVSQQPPIYQARSTLMLGQAINNPNPTGTEFYLSQQLAQTYADLAKRAPVRRATMDELGLSWLPEYSVNIIPGTMLIELVLNDTSPERAMVVANELTRQIILQSPTSASEQEEQERQDFINTQLDDLEIQIDTTRDEIKSKQQELATLFSARQISEFQIQIAALQAKQTSLQDNYASLLTSSSQDAINSLSVFDAASLPVIPVGPNRVLSVVTAAILGFALGAAAAYLLEYLDDTIKTPEDVKNAADLTTLVGIATYDSDTDSDYTIITLNKPRSPISEAFRTLRTAILFANVDRATSTILVTSANPSEGKSATAANLGVVMAQAGHRVLIIDADLRLPVQHKIFAINTNNFGLTNLLVKMLLFDESENPDRDTHALLEGAIHETSQRALYVLTSGSLPPNPAELVGSAKMQSLIDILSELFDYIIIDSPPTLLVTDPVVLSTRVDNVLLVSRAGTARRNQLSSAAKRLREVNANLVGVVLNRVSAKTSGYYYHDYYAASYYTDDKSDKGGRSGRKRKKKKIGMTPPIEGDTKPGLLARMFGQ